MADLVLGLAFALLLSCGVTYCEYREMVAAKVELRTAIRLAEQKQGEYDDWEKDTKEQLARADADKREAQRQLDAERAKPRPRLVCHQATGGGGVPAAAGQAGGDPAPAGGSAAQAEASFDPTGRVLETGDWVEDLLGQCRDALNRWPRKLP